MAEGEGFEPPVPFRVQRFSRPPVSTTHTSLRGGWLRLVYIRSRVNQETEEYRLPSQEVANEETPVRIYLLRPNARE